MSNSLQSYGLQPTRLLCPWDSPSKNIGVGCHTLLQGIFPTPVSYISCIGRSVLYHYNHHKACVCVCVCVCVSDFSHQSFSVYSSLFELPEVRWAFKCCIFLNTTKVIKCIYCHSTLAESGTASQVPALKMLQKITWIFRVRKINKDYK